MSEKNRINALHICKTVFKAAIAAAVIFWLFRKNATDDWQTLFKSFNYYAFIPAILISLAAVFVSALRWRFLAMTIGIKLSCLKAFSLTMQGNFFSLVIPGGAIGGDVIKMAALAGNIKKGTRTEGIFSIIMDRIVGMIGLFAAALFLLIIDRKIFHSISIAGTENNLTGIMLWWIFFTVCLAGLAAGTVIFFHKKIEIFPGIKQLFRFIDNKSAGTLSRMSAAADIYSCNRGKIFLWILATLFIIHLAPVFSMYFLICGSGGQLLLTSPLFTAVVIGNIAGLIPLFPGGIGARDAVTVALMTAAAIPGQTAAAAQIMATLLLISINLIGAVFFIFDRKNSEDENE